MNAKLSPVLRKPLRHFARIYDQLGKPKSKPSNIWSGDEEAREVVEERMAPPEKF